MSNVCNIPFENFKDIAYLKSNMSNIISLLDNETKEYNSNMQFQDTAYLTVGAIRKHIKTSNRIRQLKNQQPLSFIIVDYLQLLSSEAKKSASIREQEIAVISRALKVLAKDFNLCVIELAQVSRNVENRANKRPELADLRESGSIEQDADNVVFIVRPEYYGITENEDGNPTKEIAEIKIAKNRDGKTGLFEMKCDLVYQRFDNLGTVYLQDNISSQSTTADWSV